LRGLVSLREARFEAVDVALQGGAGSDIGDRHQQLAAAVQERPQAVVFVIRQLIKVRHDIGPPDDIPWVNTRGLGAFRVPLLRRA